MKFFLKTKMVLRPGVTVFDKSTTFFNDIIYMDIQPKWFINSKHKTAVH